MTPSQHKAQAEALLTAFEIPSPTRLVYPEHTWLVAQAHAHLARAAGTGAHYTAADALLAEVDGTRVHPDSHHQRALTHALLADV